MLASLMPTRAAVLPSTRMNCSRRPCLQLAQRRQPARSACLRLRAYRREYPDPEFIEEVKQEFPDKMIANTEEARALLSLGYQYVDVRPSYEFDDLGHAKEAINVPVMHLERKWSSEEQKKVSVKTENEYFIEQFESIFPDKDTPILVACSNGTAYSMEALQQLEEAGYENLVALKGGYYAWTRAWDHNLRRRRAGEYAENYTHGADSAGIHASGAGFARVDAIESWTPPEY